MSAEKIAVMPMEDYEAICDKVRSKTGGTALLKSGDIPSELDKLVEGEVDLGTKTITENGSYLASEDGLSGYSSVEVDIPSVANLGSKVITENGSYSAATDGLDGYSDVEVNIPESGGTDVSGVTATEADVLEGAVFVDSQGEEKTGTIPVNGAVGATIDGIEVKSVEIPAGYTTGGTVALDGTIDNAVEAAKTSLANKGVEVPTDTDVRDLAGLIDSITGGSGGSGGALQELTVTPTAEKQESLPGEGYVGFSKVITEAVQTQEKTATENGEVVADAGKYLTKVIVDVQPEAGSGGTINAPSVITSADGVIPDIPTGTATVNISLSGFGIETSA